MNPILPLWEYIPDGDPRVFGDRVYLYVRMTEFRVLHSVILSSRSGLHRSII